MKAIVVVLLLSLAVLCAALISVNEQQAVVVSNYLTKQQYVLGSGVHLVYPGIDKVDYIFMNPRHAVFTGVASLDDGSKVEIGVLVCWQVVNPLVYAAHVQNPSLANKFKQDLVKHIANTINARAKFTNLSTLNQLDELLDDKEVMDQLGIVINSISINDLQSVVTESAAAKLHDKQESGVIAAAPLAESKVRELSSSTTVLESAYYQAHLIKLQADILRLQKSYHIRSTRLAQ